MSEKLKYLLSIGINDRTGEPAIRVRPDCVPIPVRELASRGQGPFDIGGQMVYVERNEPPWSNCAKYVVTLAGGLPLYQADPGQQGVGFHEACRKLQAASASFIVPLNEYGAEPALGSLRGASLQFTPYEPEWMVDAPLFCFVGTAHDGVPAIFHWTNSGREAGPVLSWMPLRHLAKQRDKGVITLASGCQIAIDSMSPGGMMTRFKPCGRTQMFSLNPSGMSVIEREKFRLNNCTMVWTSETDEGTLSLR